MRFPRPRFVGGRSPSGAAGRPRAASRALATGGEQGERRQLRFEQLKGLLFRRSGGAGSGGEPDKAGAECEEE
jgi:hypothetical protein